MQDRELYAKLLGIESPWKVTRVEMRTEDKTVEVVIEHGGRATCPECGEKCSRYDARTRSWRHLDTMQYQTLLTADVPRVECAEHGVRQVHVPWAEPGSGFTALFEALVIDWLKESSVKGVAEIMRMSWDEVDGVMKRAVARGLARRRSEPLRKIGIDETSFQKRHEYVTVVYDTERARVLEVLDGRSQEALDAFYESQPKEHLATIQSVSMDMWQPYIQSTLRHVPNARSKIGFDRFHIAKHFNDEVNAVRRREHRELLRNGDDTLRGTRYLWLQNVDSMTDKNRTRFDSLRHRSLRVARAWAMKEAARSMWGYKTRGWAKRAWTRLIDWMRNDQVQRLSKLAATLERHLWGITNAMALNITNARLEATNTKIQMLKKRACGYRNRTRFRHAILFHCGALDLKPAFSAHTVSRSAEKLGPEITALADGLGDDVPGRIRRRLASRFEQDGRVYRLADLSDGRSHGGSRHFAVHRHQRIDELPVARRAARAFEAPV